MAKEDYIQHSGFYRRKHKMKISYHPICMFPRIGNWSDNGRTRDRNIKQQMKTAMSWQICGQVNYHPQ